MRSHHNPHVQLCPPLLRVIWTGQGNAARRSLPPPPPPPLLQLAGHPHTHLS